jgi:nucleotide-binding universal stress UspA family protein
LIVASVVRKLLYAGPPAFPALDPAAVVPSAVLDGDYYREATKTSGKWIEKAIPSANTWKLKVRKQVLKDEASIAKSITDYAADQKVDLVVVGTSSVGGLKRFVLGSVSSSVVNNATTSVLVVR